MKISSSQKFFEIKYEIEPGIISIAIPKIIPVDFNEATIISDKIARKYNLIFLH